MNLPIRQGWRAPHAGSRVTYVLFCLMVALIRGGAAAETNATVSVTSSTNVMARYTLAEARAAAFQRNWDLLAARAGVEIAVAQQIMAKEFPNPTASWSTALIPTDGTSAAKTGIGNGLFDRSYDTILAVNQLVEIGGKRRDRQQAALRGRRAARAQFLEAKRLLDQGVGAAYISSVLAEENARVLRESAGELNHEAEIARRRLQLGDLSVSDKNQIELNARQFELQAAQAQAQARVARVAVEVLMGTREPKGEWVAADDLEALAGAEPGPEPGAGPGGRSDLVAAAEGWRKTEYDLKLQKAVRIPDPTFLLEYQRFPEPPLAADSIGIGISFPLPLWNWNRGAIQAAVGAREQARLAMEKARTQVASDLVTTRVAYEEATERWRQYRDELLAKSRQVLESIQFAYQKGAVPLVALLDAQQSDNTLRLAAAQARADRATAVVNMAAARQTVGENDLKPGKQ
jgi:cobalt-zinc-cadmium efflux system outer membrane protein